MILGRCSLSLRPNLPPSFHLPSLPSVNEGLRTNWKIGAKIASSKLAKGGTRRARGPIAIVRASVVAASKHGGLLFKLTNSDLSVAAVATISGSALMSHDLIVTNIYKIVGRSSMVFDLQRGQIMMVRGCEKFLPAVA